jgi:hypothetical protein
MVIRLTKEMGKRVVVSFCLLFPRCIFLRLPLRSRLQKYKYPVLTATRVEALLHGYGRQFASIV